MRSCLNCEVVLKNRYQVKYCSNKCQTDKQFSVYITNWKLCLLDGSRGILSKNLSNHLKKYLLEKYGNKCLKCGWDKKHPITKRTPLEIDHIDGNAENNLENNLRLLCPNCHSLTTSFRNLNKGKGRSWRRNILKNT